MLHVQRTIVAAQWTGANSADVLEALNTVQPVTGIVWTLEDEGSSELIVRETAPWGPTSTYKLYLDWWLVVAPDHGILDRMEDAKFRACYRELAE